MADIPDLHALANTGSAGAAADALMRAGLMLPAIPHDHEVYRARVTVTQTRTATVTFLITARDLAGAIEGAEDIAPDLIASDCGWDYVETEEDALDTRWVSIAEAIDLMKLEGLRFEP